MPLSMWQRTEYLKWAITKSLFDRNRTCPGCASTAIRFIRRKFVVTSLCECESCGLRFRMPQDDITDANDFYQNEYSAGFTTDCPSESALSRLMAERFVGSEKNFAAYIAVLKSLNMEDGDALLDFGASWGYGSWQFKQAGFRVYSYEISKRRAEFARSRLSCDMVDCIDKVPERVKFLFLPM